MSSVQSPFLKEIPQCKAMMRKMRKKISKHMAVEKPIKKTKDENQEIIINILKSRNLPKFVIDPLTKRRSLDLNFLKNMTISNGASLEEVSLMTCNQEDQIQSLFKQHRERMKKFEKKPCTLSFDKKSTNFTTYSPESPELSVSCSSEYISHYDFGSERYFNADVPMVMGASFMSLSKELDSDLDWLSF